MEKGQGLMPWALSRLPRLLLQLVPWRWQPTLLRLVLCVPWLLAPHLQLLLVLLVLAQGTLGHAPLALLRTLQRVLVSWGQLQAWVVFQVVVVVLLLGIGRVAPASGAPCFQG